MKSSLIAIMALLGHVSAIELKAEPIVIDPEDPYYGAVYPPRACPGCAENNFVQREVTISHVPGQKSHRIKDAYDLDPHSVSPYDDMEFHWY